MSALMAAGLGLSLGSQIFSAIRGGQANKANQNLINKQFAENDSFYNNRVKRDFMETNAAKGIFEKLRKNLQQSNKTVDSNAAATGGTAEATIAAKSKNQENYNDAVNSLASKATDYQTGQEGLYRGENSRLVGTQMALNAQQANNAANVASNAGQLGAAAATLTGFEGVANKKNILGSLGGISEGNRAVLDYIAKK